MTGYDLTAGKSTNVVEAERMGMRTASSLAKVLKKGVQARDVAAEFVAVAWHHTSSRHNRTGFYLEPTIEIIATMPCLSDLSVHSKLLDAVRAGLYPAADARHDKAFGALFHVLAPERAFGKHLKHKRQQLERLYAKAKERAAKDREIQTVIANVIYAEFCFCRSIHREDVYLERIPVTIKGDWATFMKGEQVVRKKISGRFFRMEVLVTGPSDWA